jgi:hypothetical protein
MSIHIRTDIRRALLALLSLILLSALAATPARAEFNFQVETFNVSILDEAEEEFSQAGGHPYEIDTEVKFATTTDSLGKEVPDGSLRNIEVQTPPGLAGNPLVVPRCEEAQLATDTCAADAQVGVITFSATDHSFSDEYAIYNMVPAPGEPAELGFNVENLIWAHLDFSVGPDGAITIATRELSQLAPLAGVQTRIWGVPAAAGHDEERGLCLATEASDSCPSDVEEPKAFVSLPTSCAGPQEWKLFARSWQQPPGSPPASASSTEPGNENCGALQFDPQLRAARPTTNLADSPSGLDLGLHIPQSDDPGKSAEAHLKDFILTLPPGLVVNPAAAGGLSACSPTQIGLGSTATPSCPDAAKLGTLSVSAPAIDHPLPGALYIATPYENPFGSLLAAYVVIDDSRSGVVVKLASELRADPATGRLTALLANSPQLPFEDLTLRIRSGSGGALRTPPLCAPYTSAAQLNPWSAPDSGPPASREDTYAIVAGAGAGPCPASEAAQPNAPAFEGGTVSPIAGAYTPLVVNLRREDGSQQFSALDLTLPPGLSARLAETPRCPEETLAAAAARSGAAELATPSCPPASRIGSVIAAAGAGPAPYYTTGTAYLTGPYKGAPLGVAVVFPAVAGPFDLGTVVVRNALFIDPVSAQASVRSDPFPTILAGIPLDVRSVALRADKPNFTFNPTSCDPLALGGTLLSTQSQVALLANRFQAAECSALSFKPSLSLRLKGSTKRGGHPALHSVLKLPAGGANISRISVALPHAEFLDTAHIRTICTRVQFAASTCPKGSIYGHVKVFAPLFLNEPLLGTVYARSSNNPLPDLVAAVKGPPSLPVEVQAAGRLDSFHGGTRVRFESVPDVPFEKIVLDTPGASKGLLLNSRNLCSTTNRATVSFEGQNGKAHDIRPLLEADGCGGKGKHRR